VILPIVLGAIWLYYWSKGGVKLPKISIKCAARMETSWRAILWRRTLHRRR